MGCEICDIKEVNHIFEGKYWNIALAPDQYYLGRCFVTLRRHCGDLADLNEDEQKEFFEIVKKLESAIRKAFGARVFNWGCLMNNAFKKKPWSPHVHWHVRPRYDKKVELAGEIFEDKEFGSHYQRGTDKGLPLKSRDRVIDEIRNSWS